MMASYNFDLSFALSDPNAEPSQFLDALFEAGCDDATIGVGKRGTLALAFSREAPSAEDAVRSAIGDVSKAVPEAKLVEVKPDMVNLSDLAEIVGCSRQNMRKYASGEVAGMKAPFPSPIFTGTPSLWCLCEVGTWLMENTELKPSIAVLETAAVASDVNREGIAKRLEATREKLSAVA